MKISNYVQFFPKKKKAPNPLEKAIEKKVCDHAKALGCLVYKFTSPSRRSVPDRLFILPGGKGVFFIEFKRRGEKPTTGQAIEIAKIQAQGTAVFIVDDITKGQALVTVIVEGKRVINEFSLSQMQRVTMEDPFFN